MSGEMVFDAKVPVVLADCPWGYDQFRNSANGAASSAMDTMSLRDICRIRAGHRWAAKNCMLFMWGTGPKIDEAVFVARAWGFRHKTMFPWLKTAPKKGTLAAGIGIIVDGRSEYMTVSERGSVGGHYKIEKNPDGSNKFVRLRPRPPGVLVGPRDYPVFWDERVNDDPEFWNSLTTQILLAPKNRSKKGDINHSKKPLALYDWVEMFAGEDGKVLELFARKQPTTGFDEERRKKWIAWGRDTGVDLGEWGAKPYVTQEVVSGGLF